MVNIIMTSSEPLKCYSLFDSLICNRFLELPYVKDDQAPHIEFLGTVALISIKKPNKTKKIKRQTQITHTHKISP